MSLTIEKKQKSLDLRYLCLVYVCRIYRYRYVHFSRSRQALNVVSGCKQFEKRIPDFLPDFPYADSKDLDS